MASELGLRLNKNSDFSIEFQNRATKSRVGRKRPKQALIIKKIRAEKKWGPSEEGKKRIGEAIKKRIAKNGPSMGALGKTFSLTPQQRERQKSPNKLLQDRSRGKMYS